MAEEQKSRLTGFVGLITAVSGLIAAVVALSGVLKPMFGSSPETANVVMSNITAIPADAGAALPPGQSRPVSVGMAGRAAGAPRQGGGTVYTTTSGSDASGTREATADSPTHTEPAAHHEDPVDTAPADDTTHESE